ncbi:MULTISPECIES: YopX family protein [Bacillus]|uniref:YopX family protein n=1 Tax=Bacillus TaxID=1386 RepID=UPI000C9F20B3|nr:MULTISPECIES: YopX family protein [Bacillus]AUS15143.1 hypothetical protein C0W57_02635 [Bacillus velezensis]MCU9590294.1 YopX family protein [Bacillus velezensis]QID51039.1 hypothetical protein G4O42_13175 [Bacillus sp. LUNF1]UQN24929.1 YopX family protein [Bacillus velezensis]URD63142.1 YopX family protein [Bacillus velezensis]
MKTAYRVWDGEQMHYGDDVNLNLFIRGKVWTLYKDSTGLCPDIVATNPDGKSVLMNGSDQFEIGQFDSDGKGAYRSGKRIYAGDIVRQHDLDPDLYGNPILIGEVKMIDGSWRIVNEKKQEVRNLFSETAINSVIGDVYQNPELLEGAE